ncbi:MAG: hypothetical protein ACI3X1_01290, partial [Eubacteriales bacterium]
MMIDLICLLRREQAPALRLAVAQIYQMMIDLICLLRREQAPALRLAVAHLSCFGFLKFGRTV